MGGIEEIYADLDTDVSEAEFREAVEAKVEQMEGLADEETAAMILAHELGDNEAETIADVEAAMDEVKFVAKVRAIDELRTFERDDGEGKVINVEAADETGSIRLAFWDERAQAIADGELEPGEVLKVQGRPKDGYSGLEVSVDRAEPADVDIDVELGDDSTIEGLAMGQSDVTLRGTVLDTEPVRTFERDDGTTGKVANLTLGDETGRVRVTVWDDRADRVAELEPETSVEVVDGYVKEREGSLELHVGDRGAIDEIAESVTYEPDATPIADVELDETVDIAGVVRSTDPKRTFDRDDGSEGQVRNIRLQDDTDDIRVALWGALADRDIAPGDELLAADVDIQDGWQDDLEASAGWQSTLVVLEEGATSVGEPADASDSSGGETSRDEGAVSDGGGTGLDAFTDGEAPAPASAAESTPGDEVAFTGTVVQTGEPVILDDGTETMRVLTDADLQLGQQVTARGTLRDDRLDADEIL